MEIKNKLVVVRGAGDLATGVIQKLHRAGFLVLALEVSQPTTIRRHVSLSTAVLEGTKQVEDLTATLAPNLTALEDIWALGQIPILVDPQGDCIPKLKPFAVVDAILAKQNLGTHRNMAPVTIGLGPGFSAPEMVTAAIETMRGHNLGRLITHGEPLANTGTPGLVGGEASLRVIHAPTAGIVKHNKSIGDTVTVGDILFWINKTPVTTPISGIVRGLIQVGMDIPKGIKAADVDPRLEVKEYYNTISDKARCLGGAVLEALLYLKKE